MPSMDPPDEPAKALCVDLPAGTFLWRIERGGSDLWRSVRGRPAVDDDGVPIGGRFDASVKVDFEYLYAALDDTTALAECLLRDVGFGAELRYLMVGKVKDARLVLLETTRTLRLVSLLDLEGLSAVRQDTWLIHAEHDAYPITRLWGHWIRGQVGEDGPDGIIWPSKRNPGGKAVIFFGDRCVSAVRRCDFERRLKAPDGRDWLDHRLRLFNTKVRWPKP